MTKIERRMLAQTQIRATRKGVIEGYAAVFDSLSDPLPGGFREQISPGTFSRTLQQRADVIATLNHNPSLLLGRTKNSTLKLSEDSKGLAFECRVADTQTGRDVLTSVARGDLDGCSFAFTTRADDWSADGTMRTLRDVDLHDISVVTIPAYPATSLAVRGTSDGQLERVGFYHLAQDQRSRLYVPTVPPDPEAENLRRLAKCRLVGLEIGS